MDKDEIEKLKQEMETRFKELTLRLSNLEEELDAPKSKDWNESAQEGAGDEVKEELGNNALMEVYAIEAALKRIEDGTYGFCTKCGDEIDSRRLQLVPYAPFCTNCI